MELELISSERNVLGKTTLRIYDEKTMRLLRWAKELMDSGMTVAEAFAVRYQVMSLSGGIVAAAARAKKRIPS